MLAAVTAVTGKYPKNKNTRFWLPGHLPQTDTEETIFYESVFATSISVRLKRNIGPEVFSDFIPDRVIATRIDRIRLMRDGDDAVNDIANRVNAVRSAICLYHNPKEASLLW